MGLIITHAYFKEPLSKQIFDHNLSSLPEKLQKETLRYILTLLFTAIGGYIGIRIGMNDMKNDINNNYYEIVDVQKNIGDVNIGWMYNQHIIHGEYIGRLVPNQLALAKDCKKTLLLNFDDIRSSNDKY